uniref:Uncharacterized protein n=1 Tax=Arundo donax TaxID=35708 RepID=A0A0A9GVE7_ARUDO
MRFSGWGSACRRTASRRRR